MQSFCARRAENFPEICIFFARVGRKICVIPTLDVCFFSDLNAILTLSTLSDIVQCAQRTMAECPQLFGAGRAEFPEFLQIFLA